jgi:hypothetical protein
MVWQLVSRLPNELLKITQEVVVVSFQVALPFRGVKA